MLARKELALWTHCIRRKELAVLPTEKGESLGMFPVSRSQGGKVRVNRPPRAALFLDPLCGGAWPLLVGGVICLVDSVNERDLDP